MSFSNYCTYPVCLIYFTSVSSSGFLSVCSSHLLISLSLCFAVFSSWETTLPGQFTRIFLVSICYSFILNTQDHHENAQPHHQHTHGAQLASSRGDSNGGTSLKGHATLLIKGINFLSNFFSPRQNYRAFVTFASAEPRWTVMKKKRKKK